MSGQLGSTSAGAELAVDLDRLIGSHARVLRAPQRAEPLTREALAQAAGVSVTSSTTGAALSTLADMDMVERDASGRFMLAESFRANPTSAGDDMLKELPDGR